MGASKRRPAFRASDSKDLGVAIIATFPMHQKSTGSGEAVQENRTRSVGTSSPGFFSKLCYSLLPCFLWQLTKESWKSYSASLDLNFLICEVGISIPTS